MANVDSPFGLRPVGTMSASSYSGQVIPMYVAAGYGTALFIGDPVVKVAGGSNTAREVSTTLGTFEIGTLPNIERASVVDAGIISGVIVGFAPETQDSPTYSAASTKGIALVCVDREMVYEIQADGAIAATAIGLNAVGIYTHSGNTATGLSGLEIDSGTTTAPSADASNPFLIVAQKNAPDNETNSAHNKLIVKINASSFADGALGV